MGNLATSTVIPQNTLNELQFLNMEGFMHKSVLIDILFGVFIVLIIAYLIWTRDTKK